MKKFILMSTAFSIFFLNATISFSQVPTIDSSVMKKREADKEHSGESVIHKSKEKETTESTECNVNRTDAQIQASAQRTETAVIEAAMAADVDSTLARAFAKSQSNMDTCKPGGVMHLVNLGDSVIDVNNPAENSQVMMDYLKQLKRQCGQVDFQCMTEKLAPGLTPDQQTAFANQFAANYQFYASQTNVITRMQDTPFNPTPPSTSSGSAGVFSGGVKTINNTSQIVSNNNVKVPQRSAILDTVAKTTGKSERYQEAWDANTRAKGLNLEALNALVLTATAVNQLLLLKRNLANHRKSRVKETTDTSNVDVANPFTCDTVLLAKLNVPQDSWPKCAKIDWNTADGRVIMTTTDGATIVVATIQSETQDQ